MGLYERNALIKNHKKSADECPSCKDKSKKMINKSVGAYQCAKCSCFYGENRLVIAFGALSCPYCGGRKIIFDQTEDRKLTWAVCVSCKASGPHCENIKDVIPSWNSRNNIGI